MSYSLIWSPPYPGQRLSFLSLYLTTRGQILYLGVLASVCVMAGVLVTPDYIFWTFAALNPLWLPLLASDVVVSLRAKHWRCASVGLREGWTGPSAPSLETRARAAEWLDLLRHQAPLLPPTSVKADLDGGVILAREAGPVSSMVAINAAGHAYYAVLEGEDIRESIELPAIRRGRR